MSLIKRKLPNEKNEKEFIFFKEKPTKEELNNLTITNIIFNFNEVLEPYFQDANITHLIFGEKFNQQVNNLPKKLNYLLFGGYNSDFNQPINNLPINLKYLVFCLKKRVCIRLIFHNIHKVCVECMGYFRVK